MSHVKARSAALLGAGVLAGGILAGTLSANAASTATPSAPPGASATTGAPLPPPNAFSSTPVRPDEKALGATLAASLKEKAEARTGGTAYRVESDAGDGTYEAHVKKADGSLVTVKFDSAGTITAVEEGMGTGDAPRGMPPAGAGATHG